MMTTLEKPDPDESFEALLQKVQPTLKQILGRYQIPPEDAEDVLQDTLLTLLYKWDTVIKPEAWLIGTLRRRCIMYWRSRRSRLYEAVDEAILELVADAERPSQEQSILRRDLERTLVRLRPRCRAILRLRYGLGLKPNEIAEQLGYRQSSVRKVANRCLAALVRQLVEVGFLKEASDG
ncbi:MAG: sigma-70 family RNA polymerase sigma factor [Acidobacteriota bacterium]|jgi:RNA polymerase sigma factor (sigma-70 family)|nr:sigma-70 family RNA polymerase sigma factor [Acidobacteriota bacterium]